MEEKKKMIIGETYVNHKEILRMSFVQGTERFGDGAKVPDPFHRAEIISLTGTQIQVKCTKDEYLQAIKTLEKEQA